MILAGNCAAAQTYLETVGGQPSPSQETYVVDSKGTTLYRNGAKVCRVNCAPVAARPSPPSPPQRLGYQPPAPPATPTRHIAADSYPRQREYPLLPDERDRRAGVMPYPTPSPAASPAYPVRPAAAPVYPIYPVAPPAPASPVPAAGTAAPATAPKAATAQAGAPAGDTAPKKGWSLSKEQKAILLNVGGVAAVTGYGVWRWDYFQTAPKAGREGWFGRTTKSGGADKLAHFWSSYALGHLFSHVYRWWEFEPDRANTLGALSSLGIQTLMELGDSFSGDFGFSYEDALMNVAGAGVAYLFGKYPWLARKIDFRMEYRPQKFSDLSGDLLNNYDNQRYLVALKLDGFDYFRDSYLSYLELQAGYYTRGYEEWDPGDPDNRRRNLFFGVGFNVSKFVQNFVDIGIFDYVQVPYTNAIYTKKID